MADADVEVHWVPGAFEIPLAAEALAATGRVAGVICLGCLIKGATPHFEYISSACAHGIMAAQSKTGVPMAFGVLTTNSAEEAVERARPGPGNKGREAAQAALEMAALLAGAIEAGRERRRRARARGRPAPGAGRGPAGAVSIAKSGRLDAADALGVLDASANRTPRRLTDDRRLCRALARGGWEAAALDEIIGQPRTHWRVERMATLDQPGAADGRARVAGRARDPAAGGDQRGDRAGAGVQRRGGGPVRQRRARRRVPAAEGEGKVVE